MLVGSALAGVGLLNFGNKIVLPSVNWSEWGAPFLFGAVIGFPNYSLMRSVWARARTWPNVFLMLCVAIGVGTVVGSCLKAMLENQRPLSKAITGSLGQAAYWVIASAAVFTFSSRRLAQRMGDDNAG
jgi:hypothetical protein